MKHKAYKAIIIGISSLLLTIPTFAEEPTTIDPETCNHNFVTIKQGVDNTDEYESSYRVEKCTICGVECAVSGITHKQKNIDDNNIDSDNFDEEENLNAETKNETEVNEPPLENKNEEMKLKALATGAYVNMSFRTINNKEVELTKVDTNMDIFTIPEFIIDKGVKYNITKVNKSALKGNKYIKKLEVTKNINTIDANAFSNMTNLTEVTLNCNVKKLNKNLFKGDKKLKTININCKKLKSVNKNTFKGINKKAAIICNKSKLSKYKKLIKNVTIKSE
jgi:hypothetical protein